MPEIDTNDDGGFNNDSAENTAPPSDRPTFSAQAEPEPTQPETAQSDATQPEAAQPQPAEPGPAQSEAAQPEQPALQQPPAMQPRPTESMQPRPTEPGQPGGMPTHSTEMPRSMEPAPTFTTPPPPPAPPVPEFPVGELLTRDAALSASDVEKLESAICSSQVTEVRQKTNELHGQADSLSDHVLTRAGVTSYLLGRHSQANELLGRVTGNGLASFYQAQALSAVEKYTEAAAKFEEAAGNGHDRVEATLLQAGAIRCSGKIEEAEAVLKTIAAEAASRAEYSFQVGCIWADKGDALSAIEYFERAVDMDPHHSKALFWLAAENSLRGNDTEAIRLYEQSLSKPPYYLGALLNLGLLYEDEENYGASAFCFRRVLEFDPNNARATMFLNDIEATDDMYYDEDSARNQARLEQLLSRPVTDFELSVRSRNCLAGMNIDTLGDLTEVSEQELLAGKNFGETSLHEIRELLNSHSLRIGQNLHKVQAREPVFEANLSPEEQMMMNRSVTDLNVSVRARKCMVRLGINTIGQLIQRTPDELLASRNFGVTSLNEIRARINEMGLKLRND